MSGNDADNIAWALAEVAKLDPDRPVMHSSIYDDSFATMKNIIRRLDEFTFQRFIAGINMYFYSNNPRQWEIVFKDLLINGIKIQCSKKYSNDY